MLLHRRLLLQIAAAAPWLPLKRAAAAIPTPAAPQPPYLLNVVRAAGLAYYDGLAWLAAGHVRPGDALIAAAEPTNPHDRFAVELYHQRLGCKLGYVPRTDNKALSRLLRAGAPVWAVVLSADAAQAEHAPWDALTVALGLGSPDAAWIAARLGQGAAVDAHAARPQPPGRAAPAPAPEPRPATGFDDPCCLDGDDDYLFIDFGSDYGDALAPGPKRR